MLFNLIVALALIGSVQARLYHLPDNDLTRNLPGTFAERIVGGTETVENRYRWFVWGNGCGGQLIEKDVVLTAAHCRSVWRVGDEVYVNIWKGTSAGINACGNANTDCEKFTVESVKIHESYNSRTTDFDYLLVKLNGNSQEEPIKLVVESDNIVTDTQVTTLGFGTTQSGGSTSPDQLEATIDFKPAPACRQYSYSPNSITDRMNCGYTRGKDACQGDSGGPLIVKGNADNGRNDILVGIVSWGYGCAANGYPGVYADVLDQRSWIVDEACQLTDYKPNGICRIGQRGTNAPTTTAIPTEFSTAFPSSPISIPPNFPAFDIQDTQSATVNTIDETFTVCPGTTIEFALCYGSIECTGDTYLRLFNANNNEISHNDDHTGCGFCSNILYEFTDACQEYTLKQGCYGNLLCGGTVQLTYYPTDSTATPTTGSPIEAPAPVSAIPNEFAEFQTSNTNDAQANTVDETLYVCAGTTVVMTMCDGNEECGGDTFLRLFDGYEEIASNDDTCNLCSSITYKFTRDCRTYTLKQGCYGNSACSGTVSLESYPSGFDCTGIPQYVRNTRYFGDNGDQVVLIDKVYTAKPGKTFRGKDPYRLSYWIESETCAVPSCEGVEIYRFSHKYFRFETVQQNGKLYQAESTHSRKNPNSNPNIWTYKFDC